MGSFGQKKIIIYEFNVDKIKETYYNKSKEEKEKQKHTKTYRRI